ncbi:MAG: class I SAM-dependent methyltransferase [Desulfobacterales bacterium]|nr:class I SAM-dependent methyltransferase [Desulfobacterales bacterium]
MAKSKDQDALPGECRLRNGELTPCPYHATRVEAPIFGARRAAAIKENGMATLPRDDSMKALARMLRDGPEPAGGWWLLREQRDWLGKNLFEILGEKEDGETVHILEAGVASYIHHYTYLSIVADAMRRLNNGPRVALTVIDRCAFPIAQIIEIDRLLTSGLPVPAVVRVHNARFPVDARLAEVVNMEDRALGRIRATPLVGDVRDVASIKGAGSFDVITEHFLPAVLESRRAEIAEIRDVYARILAPGGRLLSATTMVREHPDYSEYEKIHRDRGLEKIEDASERVWNPFSVKAELIAHFLGGEKNREWGEFDAPLVNELSVHRKTGWAPGE